MRRRKTRKHTAHSWARSFWVASNNLRANNETKTTLGRSVNARPPNNGRHSRANIQTTRSRCSTMVSKTKRVRGDARRRTTIEWYARLVCVSIVTYFLPLTHCVYSSNWNCNRHNGDSVRTHLVLLAIRSVSVTVIFRPPVRVVSLISFHSSYADALRRIENVRSRGPQLCRLTAVRDATLF